MHTSTVLSHAAPPNITNLRFTHDSMSSILTCTSTGSPATNITWMRDGQPLSIDKSRYQLTQTVNDRRLSTYENVLTINAAVSNIYRHTYTCTVINVLGRNSKTVIACEVTSSTSAILYRHGDYLLCKEISICSPIDREFVNLCFYDTLPGFHNYFTPLASYI